MRTPKIILTVLLFSYLLSACDKPNPGPVNPGGPDPDPNETVTGLFEGSYQEKYLSSNNGNIELLVSFLGEGELNILGASELSLEHSRIVQRRGERGSVAGGNLYIYSGNSTELRGSYDGVEPLTSGGYRITVKITGGAGKLANTYGTLTVELTPQAGAVGAHIAEVNGTLFIRGEEKFPMLI